MIGQVLQLHGCLKIIMHIMGLVKFVLFLQFITLNLGKH